MNLVVEDCHAQSPESYGKALATMILQNRTGGEAMAEKVIKVGLAPVKR